MASEIVASENSEFRISAETVDELRLQLQDAIKAHAELERVRKNITDAAAAGWPAKALTMEGIAPRAVDADVYGAADMLTLLDVLEEV